jgi:uncharacterized membrane protein
MEATLAKPYRIESIDLLRGIVMVIMALDHTRDFFHIHALTGDPLDAATTNPILFFTRWVTHFCAPCFVFLSGLSAWLQGQRKTPGVLQRFLITRGLWLVLVDLVLMSLALTADLHYGLLVLETLWSIGISMFILGLLLKLPFRILLAIGLVIVFGHNLLDFAEVNLAGKLPVWWSIMHKPTITPLWQGHSLFVLYPFLPWTGLMILGYCSGKIFTGMEARKSQRLLLMLGVGSVAIFIILRTINIYGDPLRWAQQQTTLRTFFSFMNVQKYPPSLLFLCVTIGPALIFLSMVKNTRSRLAKVISVYGRVPLFYFVVHFIILHVAQVITYLSRGHSVVEGMTGVPGLPFKFAMPGEGYSLGIVYLIWISIVILMYPLCKWYDSYKLNHKEKWWLSYF